jgi:hypothetical protein
VSAIEGAVGYNLRTKLQFVGCLVLGLVLTLIGLINWMRELAPGTDLVGVGVFVTVATLLWIYSSRRLTWKQVAFIEDQLARSVAV